MRRLLAIAGVLPLLATVARAQQRPDFSGTWARVVDSVAEGRPSVATTGDASFRTGDMGSGWGSPVTITVRADSLVVEYPFFSAYDLQPPLRFVYALDGSESRNRVMIGHATSIQRSRLAWRDNVLVITSLYPLPSDVNGSRANGSIEVRQTLTLESPTSLVVETTRGGPATTTKTVYTKR